MTWGTPFPIKRGKGAEGVESVGSFRLLFSNVISDFSHVKGGSGGGCECKLGFRGGEVSGVHGIVLRYLCRHGIDKSELSSPGSCLREDPGYIPNSLFCILRVLCPGRSFPNPSWEQYSRLSGHFSLRQALMKGERGVRSPPQLLDVATNLREPVSEPLRGIVIYCNKEQDVVQLNLVQDVVQQVLAQDIVLCSMEPDIIQQTGSWSLVYFIGARNPREWRPWWNQGEWNKSIPVIFNEL